MLRLAQAASSENYSAWGVPPNQRRTPGKMDGELNIVPWYGGWEYVFRPKNRKVSEKIAWLMEGAVENADHIGYSQCNGDYPREGVFDALFDMVWAETREINKLVNCDCTSLVAAVVYSCGTTVADLYKPELRTMWSGTEREMLMSTGCFVELTDPLLLEIGTGIRRGDILLKTGHTAVALDDDDHKDLTPYFLSDCAECNVRYGPSTEYGIITTLKGGDIVYVVSTAEDDWKRILLQGDEYGYVSGKYCYAHLPQVCTSGDVWLRESPGKNSNPIIVIPKGAWPYVTGERKKVLLTDWYECIYGGHRGWASGKYIKA